jgi:chemotaxis protein MotA
MDPAFVIGLILAFGSLYAMITLEGAHVSSLLLPAPMVLVFGATIAVGLAGTTVRDAMRAFKAVPGALTSKAPKLDTTLDRLVELAEKARRDGLLSLEQDAAEISDPFLKNALQNIADGTDGDELRALLEEEVASYERVGNRNARFFKALGSYAPTIGIIGTVVSLTHVLENLDSPETLGHSIAAAFVATLWGLLSANFIWLPLGDRLQRFTAIGAEHMTLIIEGALAIQSGSQPRVLAERLRALVPGVKPAEATGRGRVGEPVR